MEDLPPLERPVKQGVLHIPGGPSYPLGALPPGRELADALQAALPDLQVWLAAALEYYRQARGDDFLAVLERTQLPEVGARIPDAHEEAARVLNALAGYHILAAATERDAQAREDAVHEVTKWISRANRLDTHILTATSSALSNLLSGKLDTAESHLDQVRDSTLSTMLVRAAVHYGRGEFQEALKLFGNALRSNPKCPASVRFGLGLCYYRLGRQDMAEKCFLSALQLDDQLVEPRVALAIIKLNSGDPKEVQPAMKLLQEAFKVDDNHPRVLNFFADHYIFRRDYDKVIKLAERARANTDSDVIYSESEYHLGRAHHARGEYAAAHTHFSQAVDKNPRNLLAQFGLAQVLLHDGEVEEALSCLERVLERHPDDFSTLQLIGTIHGRQGREDLCKEYLQRAIDADTADPEALVEFGQLMESSDRSKSLMAYRAALRLFEERNSETEERLNRLRNNVAVMHHRLGEFDKALAVFVRIFTGSDDGDLDTLADSELVERSVSMAFNLARLHEDARRFEQAQSLYKAILDKHVAYTDCYLRLSIIMRTQGDNEGAMKWLQTALTVENDLPDALAMMGNILIERHELHAAQLKFERILEKADRNDPYALVSLGNIYFMARTDRRDRKDRNLKFAADSFLKVLKVDPTNLYAANGVGNVFAAEGRLGAAGEIFTRVREGSTALGDVVVNLAHIYMARGEFQKAITLYESALRKHFNDSHPKLLLYLSKAHFESKNFDQAEEYLKRCREMWTSASDAGLRFDLALIKETRAKTRLEAEVVRSPDKVEECMAEIREARQMFEALSAEVKERQAQEEATKEGEAGDDDDEDNDEDNKKNKKQKQADGEDGNNDDDKAGKKATPKAKRARRSASDEIGDKALVHVTKCDELLVVAEAKLEEAQRVLQTEEELRRQREERQRQREEDKLAEELRKKEEAEKRAQELAQIAEKDMIVLREEMVHWKPLSTGGGGQVGRPPSNRGDAGDGEPREPRKSSGKKKKSTKRREIEEELAELTPVAKSPRKSSRQRTASAPARDSAKYAYEDDEDDELEEWQKARMNPKLSSIVESKRVRDEREKYGTKRRRGADVPDFPPEAAPAEEEQGKANDNGGGGGGGDSNNANSNNNNAVDDDDDDDLVLPDEE